ncbi:MAG: hypothetical protein K0R08_795 [Solimicrobium sp.]|jgi:hypothetical protein|nr:hypothetical protein [Solimicrobium sp.]
MNDPISSCLKFLKIVKVFDVGGILLSKEFL